MTWEYCSDDVANLSNSRYCGAQTGEKSLIATAVDTLTRLDNTMGISQRLWDDSVFLPAGETMPEPALAGQLLSVLHLRDAPHEKQVEGIRDWLRDHSPSKSLEMSLDRRGFGDALRYR